MPNKISIHKEGTALVGADLHNLLAVSGLSVNALKYFLGKPANNVDFLSENKKFPIESIVFSALIRFLFSNLQEFSNDVAELVPDVTPQQVRHAIDGFLPNQQSPYDKPLSHLQFAGLFGCARTWAHRQGETDTHDRLRGVPETMLRASTVLMHGLQRKGVVALKEWYAIMASEAKIRNQPEAMASGWVAGINKEWHADRRAALLSAPKKKSFTVITD